MPGVGRLRDFFQVGYRIFWLGDMRTVRGQLAIASVVIAGLLWWHPEAFARRGFAGMSAAVTDYSLGRALSSVLGSPASVWAWAFMSHGLLAVWQLWDRVMRPRTLFAINAWGFFVWLCSTALINVAVGELTPTTALEMVVLANAFASLCRSGRHGERQAWQECEHP